LNRVLLQRELSLREAGALPLKLEVVLLMLQAVELQKQPRLGVVHRPDLPQRVLLIRHDI
jgi:hypothetical protein